ncbi:MAG TPA: hypothetical protein V6C97_12610 [Oculatellaceae cyanobacterium]
MAVDVVVDAEPGSVQFEQAELKFLIAKTHARLPSGTPVPGDKTCTKETSMKKSLLVAVALFGVILASALPASAQVVVQFGGPRVVVVPAPSYCVDDYGYEYVCGSYPYAYIGAYDGWYGVGYGPRYYGRPRWDGRYWTGGRYWNGAQFWHGERGWGNRNWNGWDGRGREGGGRVWQGGGYGGYRHHH